VAGVGDQRDRIGQQTIDDLNHDKAEIESHPDCESEAKARGRVNMRVIMRPMRALIGGIEPARFVIVMMIVGQEPYSD
jgi:hypothetical protein